jgi:hypothetical protein
MKRYDCGDKVTAASFWPQDDVKAAYAAVETEKADGGELYALRRFHRRMQFFLNTAMEDVGMDIDREAVAYAYEAPDLERDLAAIRCGVCPVSTCPSAAKSGAVPAPAVPVTAVPVMKPYIDGSDHGDGLNALIFSPAERVKEIFERRWAAANTPREAEELRIFALRMDRLYDTATETQTWWEDVDTFKFLAQDEADKDAEFVRKITGGA